MEGSLRLIAASAQWIAIILTLHLMFKDCSGISAIKKLEERIMRERIGEGLVNISRKLDKITEKIDKVK